MVRIFKNEEYPPESRYCALLNQNGERIFGIAASPDAAKQVVEDFIADLKAAEVAPRVSEVASMASEVVPRASTLTQLKTILEKRSVFYYDDAAPYFQRVLCIADGFSVDTTNYGPTFIELGALEKTAMMRVFRTAKQFYGV